MASDLSRESILRGLTTTIIGRSILYHPTVSSTMDVAREAAVGGAPEGTTIVSEEQTSGRGRLETGLGMIYNLRSMQLLNNVARLPALFSRGKLKLKPRRIGVTEVKQIAARVREIEKQEGKL